MKHQIFLLCVRILMCFTFLVLQFKNKPNRLLISVQRRKHHIGYNGPELTFFTILPRYHIYKKYFQTFKRFSFLHRAHDDLVLHRLKMHIRQTFYGFEKKEIFLFDLSEIFFMY